MTTTKRATSSPIDLNFPPAFRGLWLPRRHKVYHGGRGSAKSHSVAAYLVERGYREPLRYLCTREIQRSLASSVKQLLDDKIKVAGLQGFYRSTQYDITAPNGTLFLFAGLRTNPDSIKSMEGLDGAWIEEANRASQRSLDLLLPTLRKPGSELISTFNRTSPKDPVDAMYLGPGGPPPGSLVRQVNHDENPFFPQVLKDEMEWDRGRDHDKYRHVWLGEPLVRSNAQVFRNWKIDDLDGQVPEDVVARYGGDWGYSRDPTVLVKLYRWDNVLYIRKEAWRIKCEIDETPALWFGDAPDGEWTNLLGHPGMPEALHEPIVADSARPETISHLNRRYGTRIRPARKGPGSVVEGVEFIKTHDVYVHPDCKHVIDEMETYSYKTDTLTEEPLSELADRKNHTVDSVRYALEDVRRAERRGAPAEGSAGLVIGEDGREVPYVEPNDGGPLDGDPYGDGPVTYG